MSGAPFTPEQLQQIRDVVDERLALRVASAEVLSRHAEAAEFVRTADFVQQAPVEEGAPDA